MSLLQPGSTYWHYSWYSRTCTSFQPCVIGYLLAITYILTRQSSLSKLRQTESHHTPTSQIKPGKEETQPVFITYTTRLCFNISGSLWMSCYQLRHCNIKKRTSLTHTPPIAPLLSNDLKLWLAAEAVYLHKREATLLGKKQSWHPSNVTICTFIGDTSHDKGLV